MIVFENWGSVLGVIPIYMGPNPYLMLVTSNGLVVAKPKRDLLREVLVSPPGLSRFVRTKAIVELSRIEPHRISKVLEDRGFEIINSIKRDMIRYVEFKRRLFGLGVVAMIIHTIDGKKHDFSLIYGPGKGIDRDEALENAVSKLRMLGIRIEKKI